MGQEETASRLHAHGGAGVWRWLFSAYKVDNVLLTTNIFKIYVVEFTLKQSYVWFFFTKLILKIYCCWFIFQLILLICETRLALNMYILSIGPSIYFWKACIKSKPEFLPNFYIFIDQNNFCTRIMYLTNLMYFSHLLWECRVGQSHPFMYEGKRRKGIRDWHFTCFFLDIGPVRLFELVAENGWSWLGLLAHANTRPSAAVRLL